MAVDPKISSKVSPVSPGNFCMDTKGARRNGNGTSKSKSVTLTTTTSATSFFPSISSSTPTTATIKRRPNNHHSKPTSSSTPTLSFAEYQQLCQMEQLTALTTDTSENSPRSFLLSNLLKNKCLPPEIEEGNIEYKLKLVGMPNERLEHLATQMKWRLSEFGECFYEIGVDDDGTVDGISHSDLEASLATIRKLTKIVNAKLVKIRRIEVKPSCWVAEVTLRHSLERPKEKGGKGKKVSSVTSSSANGKSLQELRVAVLGDTNSGKSTLLSVLARGDLDDGNGSARLSMLRHRHEVLTGQTSSVSFETFAFDENGVILNSHHPEVEAKQPWKCQTLASKWVTLIDVAGHPKYFKTIFTGLSLQMPNHIALVIDGSSSNISSTTIEHLQMAIALNIPLFVIVTKLDLMTEQSLMYIISNILNLLKGAGKEAIVIDSENIPSTLNGSKTIPIFLTSSVSGEFIDFIKRYLFSSPHYKKIKKSKTEKDFEFIIDEVYDVPQVGLVVSGIVHSGYLSLDHTMRRYSIGPFSDGTFTTISIHSMQRNRVPISCTNPGERITMALSPTTASSSLGKSQIQRGMVIVEEGKYNNKLTSEFEAKLNVSGQELIPYKRGIVCVRGVRQAGMILDVQDISAPSPSASTATATATSSTVIARVKLMKRPLCLSTGLTVFFWHGKSKAIGTISATENDLE